MEPLPRPGWSAAPAGTRIGDLVRVGQEARSKGGTGVDSSIGEIAIDLQAIRALFAATAH
jgi:hypothetical protein